MTVYGIHNGTGFGINEIDLVFLSKIYTVYIRVLRFEIAQSKRKILILEFDTAVYIDILVVFYLLPLYHSKAGRVAVVLERVKFL